MSLCAFTCCFFTYSSLPIRKAQHELGSIRPENGFHVLECSAVVKDFISPPQLQVQPTVPCIPPTSTPKKKKRKMKSVSQVDGLCFLLIRTALSLCSVLHVCCAAELTKISKLFSPPANFFFQVGGCWSFLYHPHPSFKIIIRRYSETFNPYGP